MNRLRRIFHRIAHLFGLNCGRVETWWMIHMGVCVACRGFYAHLKQKYGYVHPGSARLRCLDLGLIHVRPL